MKLVFCFFWKATPRNSSNSIWVYAKDEATARQRAVDQIKSNIENGAVLLPHVRAFDHETARSAVPAGLSVESLLSRDEKIEYKRDYQQFMQTRDWQARQQQLDTEKRKRFRTGLDQARATSIQGMTLEH